MTHTKSPWCVNTGGTTTRESSPVTEIKDNPASSLPELIRRIVDGSDLSDPREIAEAVAAATPEDAMRAHYATSLIGEVRRVLGAQRNNAMTNALHPTSAKLAQRRDWWAEMLASRIHVGGSWLTLGECGREQLAYAANERRADAARELQRAESFDLLISLLRRHKVATVAELPASAIPTAVRDAA